MSLKRSTEFDKRGLIAESYHMENMDDDAARAIFLDWAMLDAGEDPYAAISHLWELYGAANPDHPMSKLLRQGIDNQLASKAVGRRRRSR